MKAAFIFAVGAAACAFLVFAAGVHVVRGIARMTRRADAFESPAPTGGALVRGGELPSRDAKDHGREEPTPASL